MPCGFGALLKSVFLATCFLLFKNTENFSLNVMLNLSDVVLIGELCLRFPCVLSLSLHPSLLRYCIESLGWAPGPRNSTFIVGPASDV